MNIKSLIRNRIIIKGFSFYKNTFLILLLYVMQYHFIFQYFDPTCLIFWSSKKPETFNLFGQPYPANYLNAWNSSITLYNANLLHSTSISFALKAQWFTIALFILLLLCQNFLGISGNSDQKSIFQTIQPIQYFSANTIQLILAIKGNFSGLLSFWKSCNEGEFPRDYLTNSVPCLFVYH